VQYTAVSEPKIPFRQERRRQGPLRLLFVGRTTREKGLDLLIDAGVSLRERSVEFFLTVVGDIRPDHELCRRAREHSLPVEFVGLRGNTEARAMMAEADLLVVPSRYDACPVVAIEALTAGTPVVATSVGGLPELVQSGETGVVVPPDSAALASAISEIARDPQRHHAMRLAARRAGERFLWRSRVREVLATYRSAMMEARTGRESPDGD
jgi:glycogen(starch) synthase